jgi:hypothetical protein
MHGVNLLLKGTHETGKACNDQNTFNFIRPQHACISFLSAIAWGCLWILGFVATRLSDVESIWLLRTRSSRLNE